MKVVINRCHDGFGLSAKAELWLYESGYNEEGFITPLEKYFGNTDPADAIYFQNELNKYKSVQLNEVQ